MSETVSIESLLEHRGWVRDLARRLVRDEARADDVEQEVWLSALRRPPRHAGALRAWLARLVRSRAMDASRGDRRRVHHEAAAEAARPAPPPAPGELLARLEVEKRVVAAVEALPEPCREAVLLRWFEGLPPREIAARLGIPVETVRTRLKRALARIREALDDGHGGDGRRWLLALLPLVAFLSPRGEAHAAPAVGVRALLVAAAALVLLAVSASLVATGFGGEPAGPPVPSPGGLLAAAAGAPPQDAREEETAGDPGPVVGNAPGSAPPVRSEGGVPVEVRDLADGGLVPRVRFEMKVRGAAGTETVEAETDSSGVLRVPPEGLVSLTPAGDWRIPKHDARVVLEGREVWIHRSVPVEGTVTAEGDEALNPTSVELALSIDERGLDPRSSRATWLRRVETFRRLPAPRIDGAFDARIPAVGTVVLAARHRGWLSAFERVWCPSSGEGPVRVDLVLRAACRVSGVLRREDGTPVGGRHIDVTVTRVMTRREYDAGGFVRVPGSGFTSGVGAERAVVNYWTDVRTGADGRFEVVPPIDGEVGLFVSPIPGTRPVRVLLGNLTADVPDLELTLEDLRDDRRVAFIRRGLPAAGAKIRIMILEGNAHHHFRVRLDAKGEMPADLLTPGTLYSIRLDEFAGAGGRIVWTGEERSLDLGRLEEAFQKKREAR